jgi:hypothetical protein
MLEKIIAAQQLHHRFTHRTLVTLPEQHFTGLIHVDNALAAV